jgi:predicted transcriptional regulator of viral defense system
MAGIYIRHRIPNEELDYQTLLDVLSGYSRPRAKITALLRDGVIVRVKKGLYVLGEEERRKPLCRELLANLIYGPSCVSLEYALASHGLIPERVETVTSVTSGRSRAFDTPVGRFTYRMISMEAFPVGVDRVETGDGRAYLIATPEKSLSDALVADRRGTIGSRRELASYLDESLRIDMGRLKELDRGILDELAKSYRSRKVRLLASLVGIMQKEGKG